MKEKDSAGNTVQKNILAVIAERTRERIEEEKKTRPFPEVRRQAEEAARRQFDSQACFGQICKSTCGAFFRALAAPGLSFICEVKKASPSRGIIAEEFPYLDIACQYEAAGAAAISCLTEPFWFLGKDAYLREIAPRVSIPVLRKDFTVDEYMIYQAKALGASAILLICSILEESQLAAYLQLASSLGLDVLTEAHSETEISQAVRAGASIIGVNNRNLKTFEVDIENSRRLRSLVPSDVIFVSESGVKTAEDVAALYENGTDAVLIGETLMRAEDKKAMLDTLRGKIELGQDSRGVLR